MHISRSGLPGRRRTAWVGSLASAALAAVAISAVSASPGAEAAAPAARVVESGWDVGTLSDSEIHALVDQMSLAEKQRFVGGGSDTTCSTSAVGCVGQAGTIVGVSRLGIPTLRMTDGPAGIRLSYKTTALPAPVNLSATWNADASADYGTVMGREGKATNQDVLLAPMINQSTVATAGRNFETLGGEDSYLAGELVYPQIEAAQAEGLITTIKHFVMNDFENSRNTASVKIDERTFREGEMRAFERAIEADPGAVMCSYNRIKIDAGKDRFACSSGDLLNGVLRGELGYEGLVMSDWGGVHWLDDLAQGTDIQMPSPSSYSVNNLTNATTNGTATTAETNDNPVQPARTAAEWQEILDNAVFHVLAAENKAGLLEGTEYGSQFNGTPEVVPTTRPTMADVKDDDLEIAEQIAAESATLLKNEDSALPLTADDLTGGGVVMMGPTSVAPYIGGGGSANVTPYDEAPSPYGAVKSQSPAGSKVTYVPGYDLDGDVVPATALTAPAGGAFDGQQGLVRSQISTTTPATGTAPDPCTTSCAADRLDTTVNYTDATSTLAASTAWRWQGTITAPAAGSYQLKVFVKNQGSAQLYVDGIAQSNRRVNLGAYGVASGGIGGSTVSSWHKLSQTSKSHDPVAGKLHQGSYSITMAAGETHTIDLRAYANTTDALTVKFQWITPSTQTESIAEAVAAAESAETPVVFAYDEGTEGSDRGGNSIADGLKLPGYQDALITAVAEANPNTIVVLNTGDAVLMPWADDVAAILEMWYPGQLGGTATGEVLLGTVNPSGKSPITFPATGTQVPQYDPGCTDTSVTGNCPLYPGAAKIGNNGVDKQSYKTIDYTTNGIYTGYRWYDKHDQTPLFEFGRGLSYTTFAYSELKTTPTATGLDVTFTVTNTGSSSGTEVAQVYAGDSASAPVDLAERSLVGFSRIELAAGQSKTVTVPVTTKSLSFWNAGNDVWELVTGDRSIEVGSSSRDIRLTDATGTAGVFAASFSRTADVSGWYTKPVTVGGSIAGTGGSQSQCTSVTYSGPDSSVASVTLTCTEDDGTTADHTVTFAYDATAPATEIRTPAKPKRPKSWSVVRGTSAVGSGSPIASVTVKAVERRGGSWYAFTGSTWKKAASHDAALAKAKPLTAIVSDSAWQVRLRKLVAGKLELVATAVDKAGHTSMATKKQKLTS